MRAISPKGSKRPRRSLSVVWKLMLPTNRFFILSLLNSAYVSQHYRVAHWANLFAPSLPVSHPAGRRFSSSGSSSFPAFQQANFSQHHWLQDVSSSVQPAGSLAVRLLFLSARAPENVADP